ncbi:MAG: sulfatase, partial [Planctomycetota bacterium]
AVAALAAPLVEGRAARPPSRGAAPPPGGPRAIVLVTVDTLRPDVLGGGEGAAATPAIDALYADSVVFTQARTAAPWTKPSVASILTGLSPLVHGATSRRTRLPGEVKTIAESLREAGYVTIGVGLNVHLERLFHFAQGFDEYFFPARDDYGVSLGARLLALLDAGRFPALFPSTTAVTDRVLERLAALGEGPFFLWVHVLDPHWPYEPPPDFAPPPDPASRIGGRWGEHETVTSVQAGNVKLGAADRARVRALYRGEVEYVDANLGRLLDWLRRAGIYEDALIAFTSDHGEEFWEHGRFEHGHSMYDEVLRVPLAIKRPGSAAHAEIAAIVSNESLTPTLLDLAGCGEGAGPFTSPSLAGWLDPAAPDPPVEPIYGAGTYYHGEERAVVFDGLKAVLDLETGRVELYDLRADPEERQSIDALRPDDVQRALELLRARSEAAQALREELGIAEEAVEVGDAASRRLRSLGYAGAEGPAR